MAKDDWKVRLKAEIDRQEKSQREVSLAAGLGPGVINSWITKSNKDPQTDSLIRVCQVLNVSLAWVLYGYEIAGETEEILNLLQERPDLRGAVLQILKSSTKQTKRRAKRQKAA